MVVTWPAPCKIPILKLQRSLLHFRPQLFLLWNCTQSWPWKQRMQKFIALWSSRRGIFALRNMSLLEPGFYVNLMIVISFSSWPIDSLKKLNLSLKMESACETTLLKSTLPLAISSQLRSILERTRGSTSSGSIEHKPFTSALPRGVGTSYLPGSRT